MGVERARNSIIINLFYALYGGGGGGGPPTSYSAMGASGVGVGVGDETLPPSPGRAASADHRAALQQPPISRLLDVGCGEGTLSDFLVGPGQRAGYLGIDVSGEAVRQARGKRARMVRPMAGGGGGVGNGGGGGGGGGEGVKAWEGSGSSEKRGGGG